MVVCTLCLATFLTTSYAYSFSNKCKVILLCTSITVLPSSDTVLHQAVSQKQLYKKSHYECMMLSVWNGNSNKWKNWKLSCIGKSAKQQQQETETKIYWLRNPRKREKYSSLSMVESLWNFTVCERDGEKRLSNLEVFYKNMICICIINAAVYHMCHSTKQECQNLTPWLTLINMWILRDWFLQNINKADLKNSQIKEDS